MHKLICICLMTCLSLTTIGAQAIAFVVELSTDSLYEDHILEVRFTVENASGQFEPPAFEAFHIVGGPNTSTSIQMTNGRMTQQSSYTFLLKAKDIGSYFIEEAYFLTKTQTLETTPLQIAVVPNPSGMDQPAVVPYREEHIYPAEKAKEKKQRIRAKRHKI